MRKRDVNSSHGHGVRWWRDRGLALVGLVGVVAISDVACISAGDSYRAGIQAERPTDRIRAIYKAGELRDPLAVALLVDRLEDEDSGVRLYAFLALERITGKRFGYDYAALPSARAQAVDRWRTYVRERYAAGEPASVGGDGGVADQAVASP